MYSQRKLPRLLAALAISSCQCATVPPRAPAFAPSLAAADDKAKLLAISPEIDAFFTRKFETARPTALAVGILLDGELVYTRAYGVLAEGSTRPVDGDSLFRLASLTKSFTALAVLQLPE